MNTEELLQTVVNGVQQEPGLAILIAAGAYALILFLLIFVLVRQAKIGRKQARLLRGADGESLERMLLEHADGTQEMQGRITRAEEAGLNNTRTLQSCLQRVGMVRYNAFNDVGGEQSFSVALLDADGSGLVISGLYSRNDMRVYAKPVTGNDSSLTLSAEEQEAIAAARPGGSVGGATARDVATRGNGMGRPKSRSGA